EPNTRWHTKGKGAWSLITPCPFFCISTGSGACHKHTTTHESRTNARARTVQVGGRRCRKGLRIFRATVSVPHRGALVIDQELAQERSCGYGRHGKPYRASVEKDVGAVDRPLANDASLHRHPQQLDEGFAAYRFLHDGASGLIDSTV